MEMIQAQSLVKLRSDHLHIGNGKFSTDADLFIIICMS